MADIEKVREANELQHEKEILSKTNDIEDIDASYAQAFVKAIVPETDDPSTPSLSVRMILIGALFAVALGLLNGIFSFRTNSFYISGNVVALLSYPIGVFFAAVLPHGILNPGPFSIKEHVLAYTIASAAGGAPYGIENVIGQKFDKFMNDTNVTFWNSFLFILTTQMVGYGLAGMTRRFLVRPAAMYWPTSLPVVALFVSFHEKEESEEVRKVGGLSRHAFFWIAFSCMFLWQVFPSFFAPALQALSLLCMMSNNRDARIFGSATPNTGFGILSFTLDWSNFGTYFMPLSTPWWVSANFFVANAFILWIVVPIVYYKNAFHNPTIKGAYVFQDGSDFPRINSPSLYDRTGSRVNPTKFYNQGIYDLNTTAYETYAPIYLTENFAVTYGTSFFALTAGIMHVGLWYHKDIVRQTKEMLAQVGEETPDIHNELMKAYPDIPEYMYLGWFAFWMAIQFMVGYLTPFKLSWWGTILGFIIGSTGQQLGLNILTELLMGLMIPGQTIQVMTFKSYGYNIMIQALALSSDLKIGHYLHINPIHMVFSQLFGTIIGAACNTASVWIAISYFPLDTPDWTYPGHTTFYSAGAIWGAIGPARFFGPSSPYYALNLGYLFGLILPVLPFLGNKFYPHPYWRFIHFPIMTNIFYTGGIISAVSSFIIVAFIFQYVIFTYAHGWWEKYNYVLSAAFDAGSGIAVLITTLVGFKIVIPPSAVNPAMYDFYCTGTNWDDAQFQ
ncbi:OPT family small oligopeptide transporter [Batrachochytrium dendrobatidis JEL423]|uniref:OPT family small oligopeptide transporter n=1 Tax=Batrachochytrium dendrobatidis (strain JEL423) TaxID=403673 RepID=A0A177WJA4_BATDL|nr:OPT family small oligopeptide transporter [Batrachochytrium dendrobatidis JEL423]